MPWPLARTYSQPSLEVSGRCLRWGARTYVMGIINVTPDSFSGDGVGTNVAAAVRLAATFERAGADMLDVGGESSRPGAEPLAPEMEMERVLPAIQAIRKVSKLPIAVDTYHASVARAALDAGAEMVNDIHGLRFDQRMAAIVADSGAALVAMHNQRGRPFHDVAGDIRAGFDETLRIADAAGIDRGRIVLDPGFGFGWKPERNLEMIRRLPELWDYELPLLLGPSRKSTIGLVLDAPVDDRLEGTLAAVVAGIGAGADVVRVHDVREAVRAARLADAIVRDNWRAEP